MGKRRTTVYLDEDLMSGLKFFGVNLSYEVNEFAYTLLESKMQTLDATIEELKDKAIVVLEGKEQLKARMIIKQSLERQKLRDMSRHIDAAIKAGIPRGEAESDFGEVFPDYLWNSLVGAES